ncbi:MAG: peptidoglycan DD-metalloendopeptidase family protein [Deltaproteobacteria bacterium]
MSENNTNNTRKLRIRIKPKKEKQKGETEAGTLIHIGEKAIVLKSEYKNINKVFSLKGINARFRTYINIMEQESKKKYIKSKRWILSDRLRTKYFKAGIITALIVVNALLILNGLSIKYNVYVNDKYVGVINNKNDFTDLLSQASAKLNKDFNSDMAFTAKADFRPTIALKSSKADTAAVLDNLKNKSFFTKRGYAISVDGKELVVVPTKAMAEQLLEKLKQPYKKSNSAVVDFIENVEIREKNINDIKTLTFDDAFKLLSSGKEGSKVYKVQKGDTLWLIAKNNSISVSKIKQINPEIGENIREGQEIKLSSPVPLINVKTKEITTLEQHQPSNNTQQKDKKLIKAPVGKKEAAGTKKQVAKVSTGSFKRPVLGFITSRFGARWGRMHEGIDIGAKVGQSIYAADGGVVSFTGYEGGYGKLVKIRHGSKYTTYYGHCSKILVKKGQKVHKGQKIALIGMTGRTTGPHLHFEIRKNGNPVNPKKLLK